MLVSHKLGLLFAHVPKTGGSAITAALLPYLSREATLPVGTHGWQPRLHEFGNMHARWEDVRDSAQRFLDQGYVYAAVARSPYERVASLYQGKMGEGLTVEEFVRDEDGHHAWWLQQAVDVAGPLVRWLDYERLDADFTSLMRDLGVHWKPPLPRENVTQGKRPASEILTPGAIGVIRERFGDDIREFGFKEPT